LTVYLDTSDARFIDWANDYRHYVALRNALDKTLHEAA
jgi:hypothetical protein